MLDLALSYLCEKPVEQLFQSVAMLTPYEEMGDIVAILQSKLEQTLDDIPIKNGRKSYKGKIFYYPNGLCTWSNMSVILSPWQIGNSGEKPKRRDGKINYEVVTSSFGSLAYCQVKKKLKQSYMAYPNDGYNLVKFFQQLESVENLSEQASTHVDVDTIKQKAVRLHESVFLFITSDYYDWDSGVQYGGRAFRILTPEQVDIVTATLENNRGLGVRSQREAVANLAEMFGKPSVVFDHSYRYTYYHNLTLEEVVSAIKKLQDLILATGQEDVLDICRKYGIIE